MAIFFGGPGNDHFDGTAENDVLIGNGGKDMNMRGNAGDDTFVAAVSDNDDEYLGGADTDTYDLGATTADATVDLRDGTASSAQTGSDTLDSIENVTCGSSSGNDVLRGNEDDNVLIGGGGNDTLQGRGGSDTMVGGAGNDTYSVDDVGDVVLENADEGLDIVNVRLNAYILPAEVERMFFIGTGDFVGTGNALANKIVGNDGSDTLDGGAGDDILIGQAGNDTMTGGAGRDVFGFTAGFGDDIITDFGALAGVSHDTLDVRQLGITAANFSATVAISQVGADTLVQFGGGSVTLTGVVSSNVGMSDFFLAP